MKKVAKKVFIFAGILIGLILIFQTVSALTCEIKLVNDCDTNKIFYLSGESNAHGQTEAGYNYVLCCDVAQPLTCPATNGLIKLSSTTNAHAEVFSQTNYPESVCLEEVECVNETGACPTDATNPYEEIISLSSETNAHIGKFADYNTKICCRGGETTDECSGCGSEDDFTCGEPILPLPAGCTDCGNGTACVDSEETCDITDWTCKKEIVICNNDDICDEGETCDEDCKDCCLDSCGDFNTNKEECEAIHEGINQIVPCHVSDKGTNPITDCIVWTNKTCKWEASTCEYKEIDLACENSPLSSEECDIECGYTQEKEGDCGTAEFFKINYVLDGTSDPEKCALPPKIFSCGGLVKLPFFDKNNFIIAVLGIIAIYGIIFIKRRK